MGDKKQSSDTIHVKQNKSTSFQDLKARIKSYRNLKEEFYKVVDLTSFYENWINEYLGINFW